MMHKQFIGIWLILYNYVIKVTQLSNKLTVDITNNE